MPIAVWYLKTARTASLERPSFTATCAFGWFIAILPASVRPLLAMVLAFKRRERSQR